MQVEVSGAFAKCNGVDAITTGDGLHQRRGVLDDHSPLHRLLGLELARSAQMPEGIEQTPTQQRSWLGVMTQEPVVIAPDLVLGKFCSIRMQVTDSTERIRRSSRVRHHKKTLLGKPADHKPDNKKPPPTGGGFPIQPKLNL